jgi:3-hydroxyisobutyrate dehydrogenase
MDVADAVADGKTIRRFIDLSAVGCQAAQRNHALLAENGVAALDSPVSGGVHGAEAGELAVMVSGPRAGFDVCAPVFDVVGRTTFVSDKPGTAQTMKLVNNLIAATALAVTAEAMVISSRGRCSQVADAVAQLFLAGDSAWSGGSRRSGSGR